MNAPQTYPFKLHCRGCQCISSVIYNAGKTFEMAANAMEMNHFFLPTECIVNCNFRFIDSIIKNEPF